MSGPLPLFIDFETRSHIDLRKVGLTNYARHPSTEPWCMSFAVGAEEPRLWKPGMRLSPDIEARVSIGWPVVAHNAAFELAIWNEICHVRYGWPSLRIGQTICTMAACHAMSLPGGLENAARALGLHMLKDTEGRQLMLKMSQPLKNGEWESDPEKINRLYEYCKQDVRVEREVYERAMPLSENERRVWALTVQMNKRGIPVDVETAKAAVDMAATVEGDLNRQIKSLTGGEVETATALIPMKQWIAKRFRPVDSLDKQSVADLLLEDMPEDVRKLLRLRQEAGKASTAKYRTIVELADKHGRVHDSYIYHAAGTGRWSARGFQAHNMPRDTFPEAQVESLIEAVRGGKWREIDAIWGPPLTVLSRLLRPMVVAPDGMVLVGGDWSNVEGRGAAWFCGEDWKLDVFRKADAGLGPGVYEITAAAICGVPVEEVTKEQRQRAGKIPELAFQYGGGSGAYIRMAKGFGVKAIREEAEGHKNGWRAKHPLIVATWRELHNAAINATRNEGKAYDAGYPGRHATYKRVGSFLWCLLPSGRAICYPYPEVVEGNYGPQLTYKTAPNASDIAVGRIVSDPANTAEWARIGVHGGLLLENIVQGFCADFLRLALLNANAHSLEPVIHTHDDLYVLVAKGREQGAAHVMHYAMNTPPPWAKGFPLVAKIETLTRYGT